MTASSKKMSFSIEWALDAVRTEKTGASEEHDFVDVDPLTLAILYYVRSASGTFTMHVDAWIFVFEFRPDLSTIFGQLPGALLSLRGDTTSPVFLDFFEQGSELLLILERAGDTIMVRFEPGVTCGWNESVRPKDPVPVRADEFLGSWCVFARWCLDQIAARFPEVPASHEYVRFLSDLTAVELSLRTGEAR